MFDIQEELKKLPAKPGVYIMHDVHDDIFRAAEIIHRRFVRWSAMWLDLNI